MLLPCQIRDRVVSFQPVHHFPACTYVFLFIMGPTFDSIVSLGPLGTSLFLICFVFVHSSTKVVVVSSAMLEVF